MSQRPDEKDCPNCGTTMQPMMAAGGWAPEGFTPEYDHYWCDACVEPFDFDEVEPTYNGKKRDNQNGLQEAP